MRLAFIALYRSQTAIRWALVSCLLGGMRKAMYFHRPVTTARVWAVAAAFPKLFGVLAGEEKRTEMSRLAEARVEQFKSDPYALPLSITGGPAIHPNSVPDDPDIASGDANSRDDILWVGG